SRAAQASAPPRAGGYRWTNCATCMVVLHPSDPGHTMTSVRPPTGVTGRMIRISALASSVQPSATLAAGAKARQMKAAGTKVYDFSLGEPDFPTPAHICTAADEAMAA